MRKQYSAEQIILGIYQAKKKIQVFKKGPRFSLFSESYKIYCSEKKELKAWKRKLNTYCERYFKEKEKGNINAN